MFQAPCSHHCRHCDSLQPVAETQQKQLKVWRDIILGYCRTTSSTQIVPMSFPLFHNDHIDRSLTPEAIRIIAQSLVEAGNGEWEDSAHTVLRVMLQSAEQLANEVYRWASTKEILGTVYTMYELHSGDEYQDSGQCLFSFHSLFNAHNKIIFVYRIPWSRSATASTRFGILTICK
jgi:ESCRT-II complex subunit VPS25